MNRRLQNSWLVLAKVGLDLALIAVSLVAAYLFRFGPALPPEQARVLLRVLPLSAVIKLLLFWAFGNYATLWRYSSVNDLLRLIRSSVASLLMLATVLYFLQLRVPASVLVLDGMLTLTLCGAARLAPRVARERMQATLLATLPEFLVDAIAPRRRGAERRILVVGAGDAGESLVREMSRNERLGYLPVGFVDDDPAKKGLRIHGVKVRGNREDIPRLVAQHDVDEILIAIPSATAEQIRPIVDICRWTGVKLKILPDLASLVHGTPRLADVRDLRIEDLLGRPRIELDTDGVSAYLKGRRVLVTGAGGSIGSELCRQVLRYGPSELYLLGRGENSIFAIYHELAPKRGATKLYEIIGDVINKRKLQGVFERFHPEIVFHAGADKHVPLMELNPDEAVLNNILGTKNVIEICDEHGVERLVCISTDKAVNPTSIMGCCKRVAELYVLAAAGRKTRVTAVRFGNVLGSRGSVIPLFQEQIERGGPVTVTHKEVRRYFMTIPEAVALVIQAGAMAEGGDIYVLDMGDPIKIDDLARRVIRLHGLEPDKDIPMTYIGLRPGEKLNEELIGPGEVKERTSHPKIFRVRGEPVPVEEIDRHVEQLIKEAVAMDDLAIRRTLKRLVPEYQPYLPPDVQSWVAKRSS
ncbi:MAG: polysaccharide biosynthesis protein [Acidobacteria bacterium]|nr:MAG: polysaccharide biosynthesis protein [Acidobacteriota bacterium]